MFAAMPDGARKTNAALEIFGKSGVRLIPFLNNGAVGLARLREEAVRLGISIGGDTVKAADEFNDRMNTIGNAVKGIGVSIAKDALPYLSTRDRRITTGADWRHGRRDGRRAARHAV